jgi:hypothetical protein
MLAGVFALGCGLRDVCGTVPIDIAPRLIQPCPMSLTLSLLVAGLLLSVAAPGTAQRPDSPFSVGEMFPDIPLPSLADGSPTRLSDFRGRKVMLHVFASW